MGREELNEGMVAEEQDVEGVFTVERMTRIKKEKKHPREDAHTYKVYVHWQGF